MSQPVRPNINLRYRQNAHPHMSFLLLWHHIFMTFTNCYAFAKPQLAVEFHVSKLWTRLYVP
jgi:hypothetical protein